jgi:hypothetical protein
VITVSGEKVGEPKVCVDKEAEVGQTLVRMVQCYVKPMDGQSQSVADKDTPDRKGRWLIAMHAA